MNKKIIIRLSLFIVFSIIFIIASLYIYPRFYQAFMPLEVISVQYSPNKKFKAEESYIPYLHHSLGISLYKIYGVYSIIRVTNVQTGEVIGDMEDETLEAPFEFVGNEKYCIDLRFAGTRTEDEWCLDLK